VTFEIGGYEVLVADCGQKAIELAHEELPDIIVCDLMMPEMNGLSVLSELRSDSRTAAIPFVVVSGSGRDGDVEKAKELGAERFVVKPFGPADLVEVVDAVLDSKAED
jgi:CheY-like chemotaxis protein